MAKIFWKFAILFSTAHRQAHQDSCKRCAVQFYRHSSDGGITWQTKAEMWHTFLGRLISPQKQREYMYRYCEAVMNLMRFFIVALSLAILITYTFII